jgi:addiction module HigA family antidote
VYITATYVTFDRTAASLKIPIRRLALRIHVPRRRINEIVLGQRSISADTALRLARFFGTSDRFWLNLQAAYDLNVERDRIADTLARIEALQKAS